VTHITQAPRNVADTLTMDKRSERSEYTAHAALTDTARMRLPTFAHGVEGPTGRRGGTAPLRPEVIA